MAIKRRNLVFVVLVFGSQLVQAEDLRIGVLAFRGGLSTINRWQATADFLTEKIPDHRFRIVPLGLEQIRASIAKGAVDFVITNTGQYVELETFYGVSRIATRKNLVKGKAKTKFGAVIFTRADRIDIRTLEDLKGKSLMGVKETGFGGFRMAWREMLKHGVDPYEDLSSLQFSGFPQGAVAYAVMNGKVDAGTFRTESLERMALEGKLNVTDFKVLNAQSMEDYPMLRSTALYPTWPFAKLKHVSTEMAELVARALLAMPADSPAAKAAHIAGWTIPLNYQPVHELLMTLRVGPYADADPETLLDIFKRYWQWLSVIVAVILAMGLLTLILIKENRSRKIAEKKLRSHQENLIELIHERTEDVVRIRDQAISASEAKGVFLSTMSHELRSPLNAIIGYSETLLEDLSFSDLQSDSMELQKIHASALHLLGVINRILEVTRIEDGSARLQIEMFSLDDLLDDVIAAVTPLAVENNNLLEVKNQLDVDAIQTDMLRLEQALIHVLENACRFTRNGKISFTIRGDEVHDQDWVEFVVSDNGIGMTAEQQGRIFEIFTPGDGDTGKIAGIGVGLAVSRGYCRIMGGDITFTSTENEGSEFIIRIPTLISKATNQIGVA